MFLLTEWLVASLPVSQVPVPRITKNHSTACPTAWFRAFMWGPISDGGSCLMNEPFFVPLTADGFTAGGAEDIAPNAPPAQVEPWGKRAPPA